MGTVRPTITSSLAVLDAELRLQGHESLVAFALGYGVMPGALEAVLMDAENDVYGLREALAEALGVSPESLTQLAA